MYSSICAARRVLPGQKAIIAAILAISCGAVLWCRPYVSHSATAAEEGESHKPPKQKDPQIVPVLCIRPGETSQCVLSTECTVGATRGGGLSVREMGEPAHALNDKKKTWTKAGLTLNVPDFGEASKTAASPEFAALKQKGFDAFIVKATAAQDAVEGMYEIHLADDTCSGNCRTTLRVVVHK